MSYIAQSEQKMCIGKWQMMSVLLMVLCILIAILVPVVLLQNMKDEVRQKVQLNSLNEHQWSNSSSMPHKQHTWRVMPFALTSENFSIPFINPMSIQTYDYSSNYKNISFVPNTNDNIQYLNEYQIKKKDSSKFKSQYMKQVNLGVMKGFQTETYSSQGRLKLITLNSILEFLVDIWSPTHIAYMLHNQDLNSFSQVQKYFKNADITNNTLQQALYNDPNYGWNSVKGLFHWVRQTMLAHENIPYDDDLVTMQKHFNLTTNQVQSLVQKNSTLYQKIFQWLNLICSGGWNIPISTTTFRLDMAISQWSSQAISTTQCMFYTTTPTYSSAMDIVQQTQLISNFPIEFSAIKGGFNIENNQASALLSTSSSSSLMNLDNISYLVDQSHSFANVNAKLQIKLDDKLIIQLRVYLTQMYNQILLAQKQSSSDNQQISYTKLNNEQRAVAFLAQKAINFQFKNVLDNYYIGVMQQGVYDKLNATATCPYIMNQASLSKFTIQICLNSTLDFMQLENMRQWIDLFIHMQDSAFYPIISKILTNQQILQIFSLSTDFGKTIQLMSNNIINGSKCTKTQTYPGNNNIKNCDALEVSLIKWFSQNNLVTQDSTYRQLASSVFFQKANNLTDHLTIANSPVQATSDQITQCMQQYQSTQQIITYKQLVATPENIMLYKPLVVDVVMGGNILYTSVDQFLFNLTDFYTLFMYKYTVAQGGYKYTPCTIQLLTPSNQPLLQTLGPNAFNQLNTGILDISQVKQLQRVYNHPNITYITTIDNGNSITYQFLPAHQPPQQIQGTDGYNFQPFLQLNTPLWFYNQHYYSNIQLTNKGFSKQNTNYFKTFDYTFTTPSTNCTNYTNMPILITPVQNIFNQYNITTENSLQVEIYTGITQQKTESYQYNLQLDLGNVVVNVPLFIVSSQYSIDRAQLQSQLHSIYQYRINYLTILIIFIVLSVIFVIIFMVLVRKYLIQKKRQEEFQSPLLSQDV